MKKTIHLKAVRVDGIDENVVALEVSVDQGRCPAVEIVQACQDLLAAALNHAVGGPSKVVNVSVQNEEREKKGSLLKCFPPSP